MSNRIRKKQIEEQTNTRLEEFRRDLKDGKIHKKKPYVIFKGIFDTNTTTLRGGGGYGFYHYFLTLCSDKIKNEKKIELILNLAKNNARIFYHEEHRKKLLSILGYSSLSEKSLIEFNTNIKSPDRILNNLAEYLFCFYKLPKFFFNAWDEIGFKQDEYIEWFIDLGRGVSVRKLSNFPIKLTKKMAHEFFNTPEHFKINEGIRRAQLIGLNCDLKFLKSIIESNYGRTFNNDKFENLISSFILILANNPMANNEQVSPLLDYIHHKYVLDNNYNLKGRTFTSLLRQMERWHLDLQLEQAHLQKLCRKVNDEQRKNISKYTLNPDKKWSDYGLKSLVIERTSKADKNKKVIHKIIPINSSSLLRNEGATLGHCVYSYLNSCIEGRSSIWGYRIKDGKIEQPNLTIEVDIGKSRITQIRGKGNRLPKENELNFIRAWGKENNLEFSSWLRFV